MNTSYITGPQCLCGTRQLGPKSNIKQSGRDFNGKRVPLFFSDKVYRRPQLPRIQMILSIRREGLPQGGNLQSSLMEQVSVVVVNPATVIQAVPCPPLH